MAVYLRRCKNERALRARAQHTLLRECLKITSPTPFLDSSLPPWFVAYYGGPRFIYLFLLFSPDDGEDSIVVVNVRNSFLYDRRRKPGSRFCFVHATRAPPAGSELLSVVVRRAARIVQCIVDTRVRARRVPRRIQKRRGRATKQYPSHG